MKKVIMQDLIDIKYKIPKQTYLTIVGQMRAGDFEGAAKGVARLKKRIARREAANENRCG